MGGKVGPRHHLARDEPRLARVVVVDEVQERVQFAVMKVELELEFVALDVQSPFDGGLTALVDGDSEIIVLLRALDFDPDGVAGKREVHVRSGGRLAPGRRLQTGAGNLPANQLPRMTANDCRKKYWVTGREISHNESVSVLVVSSFGGREIRHRDFELPGVSGIEDNEVVDGRLVAVRQRRGDEVASGRDFQLVVAEPARLEHKLLVTDLDRQSSAPSLVWWRIELEREGRFGSAMTVFARGSDLPEQVTRSCVQGFSGGFMKGLRGERNGLDFNRPELTSTR